MGVFLKKSPIVVNLASIESLSPQDGNNTATDISSHLLKFDLCGDALETVEILHYSIDSRLKQVFLYNPLKTGLERETVAPELINECRWMFGPEREVEQVRQELAEEAQKAEEDDEIWSLDFLYL